VELAFCPVVFRQENAPSKGSKVRNTMKIAHLIAFVAMLAFSGAAYAQQPATPAAPAAKPATPAAPAAPTAGKKPRSEKSLECSKQADSQNLHGKPRKHFMSECKKS
jgi:hypothetical protein